MQFAVGVVALGSIFVAIILMMINSPIPSSVLPWGGGTIPVTIQVPQAPGVGPDTPVRKNGVLIGRVGSIDDSEDGVEVHANIEPGRALTTKHVPHVRTTVLGDATIDFMTDANVTTPQPLDLSQPIRGLVDPNPFESISKLGELQDDIQKAMGALANAGTSVDNLAKRVDNAFGTETDPGRINRFLATTENAMVEFGNAMASINEILGDAPATAPQQPGGVPQPAPLQPRQQPPGGAQPIDGQQMRQRLRQGIAELPDAIQDFRTMVRSADRNLKNLEGFTQPLGERGPQIAQSIIDAVDGIDRLVEEFTVLVQALNSREGTLGQLIHNPQLYKNLNNLTGNADTVLRYFYDLLKGLRPIVDNVRIFTDKIAQEPGRIVSGAVNPSVVK
jgi:phospholipid/cholesterol/gamma-HCH transport system substrate-binding protein